FLRHSFGPPSLRSLFSSIAAAQPATLPDISVCVPAAATASYGSDVPRRISRDNYSVAFANLSFANAPTPPTFARPRRFLFPRHPSFSPLSTLNSQPTMAEQEARKTLEERAKMSDIDRLRHSAAHVMATAILRLWPDAQFAYGPPVENGFYYDVELKHRISPEDFEKIEAEMKKEIKANNPFEKITVTREQAIAEATSGRLGGLTERPTSPSKFNLDLLNQIPEGEPISYFKNGDFIDLCAGPHVMRTGNLGA